MTAVRKHGFPYQFECQRSGNCCAIPGGFVRTTEAERTAIAKHLGMTESAFQSRLPAARRRAPKGRSRQPLHLSQRRVTRRLQHLPRTSAQVPRVAVLARDPDRRAPAATRATHLPRHRDCSCCAGTRTNELTCASSARASSAAVADRCCVLSGRWHARRRRAPTCRGGARARCSTAPYRRCRASRRG